MLGLDQFYNIQTKRELASYLGIKYKQLIYCLYHLPVPQKYHTLAIKKKDGGTRAIYVPHNSLKYIQRKIAKILLDIYASNNKNCVHGYVKGKGIKSNAIVHVNKKYIINIDLKDFFPSINFGRVRGLFQKYPFNFNDIVSTTLAQICCFDNMLPQGAPSSPIISNFICRKLDNSLIDLSKKGKFLYTRYADDITFSTNMNSLPIEIGCIENNVLKLSEELQKTIRENDFQINDIKTRYADKRNHQEVTGIVVNKTPNVKRNYIKHIRGMLHAYERFGLEGAAKEHFEKYHNMGKPPYQPEVTFINELIGKIGYIGMIRGKDDSIYKKLYLRIQKLSPNVKLTIIQKDSELLDMPVLFTEGKTDWKHIKRALEYYKTNREFNDIKINIYEDTYKNEMNCDELMKMCEGFAKKNFHKHKTIFLFDGDVKKIVKKATENGKNYKNWGNNVYSAILPVPDHRDFMEIAIEHFYKDEDIKRKDSKGNRIFLSSEFAKDTGHHKNEELYYSNKNYLASPYPRIIDSNVFDKKGINRALSKNAFADYILNNNGLYKDVNFCYFRKLFLLLQEILNL